MFSFFRARQKNTSRDGKMPSTNKGKTSVRGLFSSMALWNYADKSSDIPAFDISGMSLTAAYARRTANQARYLAVNNPVAKSYLRTLHLNVVGHKGIQMQMRIKTRSGQSDRNKNNAVEKAYKKWCRKGSPDVTGTYSMRDLQKQVAVCLKRDGEFFARHIYKNGQYFLQHIDSRLCATDYSETHKDYDIIQGVKVNKWGKPLSYFIYNKTHDHHYSAYSEKTEIPADEILHLYDIALPHQVRGLSDFAPVIFALHNLKDMNDSTLRKARAASKVFNFLKWGRDVDPENIPDEDKVSEVELNDVTYQALPPGMERDQAEFQFPSNEYPSFLKSCLRQVASALGVSYNSLNSDAESINFSSIRDFTLKEREVWKDIQETIIEGFCIPVFERWVENALMNGQIEGCTLRDLENCKHAEFIGRRWDWVDPLKDVKAADQQVRAFMKSRSGVIRDMGGDPDAVFSECAEDIQRMQDAGISDELITYILFGVSPADDKGADIAEIADNYPVWCFTS